MSGGSFTSLQPLSEQPSSGQQLSSWFFLRVYCRVWLTLAPSLGLRRNTRCTGDTLDLDACCMVAPLSSGELAIVLRPKKHSGGSRRRLKTLLRLDEHRLSWQHISKHRSTTQSSLSFFVT
ncbi:hypothetical protein NP493_833g01019 [Ridgeia piscesae]|uniref:Uncharacterized protein n=1 Tax=Ridgeia piscesae TaxID=27915 RepID=A0AAD9KMD8_RIDPI|nr:hypothetical protein NP493_833g01019 [Ridgeia piscesae]